MAREGMKLKMDRAARGAESKEASFERMHRSDAKGGDDASDAKSEAKGDAK